MTLNELIAALSAESSSRVIKHGFANPHSYRGFYDQLAFEPAPNITIASMLACARSALGATYTGYKGGEFRMDGATDVWLAKYGECGEQITSLALKYMLAHDAGEPISKPAKREPYVVVEDRAGCAHCKAGTVYAIEGPDGVCLGTMFESREQAEDLADMLSDAHRLALELSAKEWEST